MTPEWIAERRVIIVHPNGRRVTGHIAVGKPYALGGADPSADYESHCPIEIDSLYAAKHPLIGGGTLDALLNGVRMLGFVLHDFKARGGRVLDADDGSDVEMELIFGPLFQAPASGS